MEQKHVSTLFGSFGRPFFLACSPNFISRQTCSLRSDQLCNLRHGLWVVNVARHYARVEQAHSAKVVSVRLETRSVGPRSQVPGSLIPYYDDEAATGAGSRVCILQYYPSTLSLSNTYVYSHPPQIPQTLPSLTVTTANASQRLSCLLWPQHNPWLSTPVVPVPIGWSVSSPGRPAQIARGIQPLTSSHSNGTSPVVTRNRHWHISPIRTISSRPPSPLLIPARSRQLTINHYRPD